MEKQQTLGSVAWTQKGKVTRRERFLAEMDAVIPWADLLRLIEPYYPKAGNGRQPLGLEKRLEKMLRIYFVQQWFNLSDPQAEDSLYDSESIRRFVRIELSEDVVPDETTILRFRHLLEKHGLTAKIFDLVQGAVDRETAAAEVRHDWSFNGTWEPEGVGQISVQGRVMAKLSDDKETLLGLRLEGITEDADPFAVNIPIDKKLGEGYHGTDESGGSYFLRLIERTKEGL